MNESDLQLQLQKLEKEINHCKALFKCIGAYEASSSDGKKHLITPELISGRLQTVARNCIEQLRIGYYDVEGEDDKIESHG